MTQPRAWRSTGHTHQIDPELDRIPDYNPVSGEHLWIWMLAFRANPVLLGDPTHTPMLDMENLLSIGGPGCFYCEQTYSPRLAHRRCKGEP